MPLDPEIASLVAAWNALGMPRIDSLSAAAWRARYAELERAKVDLPVVADDRHIPGPSEPIRARIYRPSLGQPAGAFLYLHGGGWVVGSIESHDERCRRIAHGASCVVVSIDYRLAPEHPYPAAVEDAYAAAEWLSAHAMPLGSANPRVAIGGDSAGGNLAAVVALMIRDRAGPPIASQVLVYPVVDHDLGRPSVLENAEGYLLTRDDMKWYIDQYVPNVADRNDPYFAPLLAESLKEVAPALVITAEYDPLRDEGDAYAARLQEAGVETEHHCYDGAVHGFLGWSHASALARDAVERIGAFLRRHLAT
ncbi:MAG: alpha/beta hydrolase [Myxococcota bacterium]